MNNLCLPPKGKQLYDSIVKDKNYYVDKTRYLKTVFEEDPSQVFTHYKTSSLR